MKIWKWEKKDEVSTSRHQLPNEGSIPDVVSAALPTADIFKDLGPHFLDMIHAEKNAPSSNHPILLDTKFFIPSLEH